MTETDGLTSLDVATDDGELALERTQDKDDLPPFGPTTPTRSPRPKSYDDAAQHRRAAEGVDTGPDETHNRRAETLRVRIERERTLRGGLAQR